MAPVFTFSFAGEVKRTQTESERYEQYLKVDFRKDAGRACFVSIELGSYRVVGEVPRQRGSWIPAGVRFRCRLTRLAAVSCDAREAVDGH